MYRLKNLIISLLDIKNPIKFIRFFESNLNLPSFFTHVWLDYNIYDLSTFVRLLIYKFFSRWPTDIITVTRTLKPLSTTTNNGFCITDKALASRLSSYAKIQANSFAVVKLKNCSAFVAIKNNDVYMLLFDSLFCYFDPLKISHLFSYSRYDGIYISPFKRHIITIAIPTNASQRIVFNCDAVDITSSLNWGHWLADCKLKDAYYRLKGFNGFRISSYYLLSFLCPKSLDSTIFTQSKELHIFMLSFNSIITSTMLPSGICRSLALAAHDPLRSFHYIIRPSKIYLYKSLGNRRLLNQEQVISSLTQLGYICIDTTTLPYTYLQAILTSAIHIVVGVDGCISNLLMVSEDSRVTVLLPSTINRAIDSFTMFDLWPLLGMTNINFLEGVVHNYSVAGPILDQYKIDISKLIALCS